MKSIIFVFALLTIAYGSYKEKCNANAACEACGLSWFCEYGNNNDMKEECYKNCFQYKIDYDEHSSVQNAKETTVHEKSFIQTKSKMSPTPEKDQCKRNAACEGCALSWQCEYGQKPELIEECYKNCWENKIGYDTHRAVRDAEEIKVHY